MTENLSELFYEKLHKENNPGAVLARFYCEIFNLQWSAQKIITFNKLLKVYNRDTIFFAILDCYDMPNVTHDNIYGLLAYFCKKRMEKKIHEDLMPSIDLTNSVREIERTLEKLSKKDLKINEPFNE